jgi:preprotein translocase subunit SecD
MLQYPKWKMTLVLIVCALGVIFALPNLLSRQQADALSAALPSWIPARQVNLGLDLQGGSHLLLRVDVGVVVSEYLEAVADSARSELRGADIGYTGLGVKGRAVTFTVRDQADGDKAVSLLRKVDGELDVSVQDGVVTGLVTDAAFKQRERAAVDQSIEIVRRRVDETGTREPSIQRQGSDRILLQLPGVDDPDRIKRLLGQTAKLNFHLVNDSASLSEAAAGRVPAGSRLLPAAPNNHGQPNYVVTRRAVGGDTLVDAQPGFDQGRPIVKFRFDNIGGKRFGDVTTQSVGKQLAIVLDDKVISAPVIQSPIVGGSGIISGSFSVQEASDLALLLRAGALPAPLSVLEERTVGPGLGADSIRAGGIASLVGIGLVIVFMGISYGRLGWYANLALAINLMLILTLLSMLGATLTLPGIAGIVLTVGMAVDANVLIYERIREEMRLGRTVIGAIDAGFSRAFGTILDSNITTLIAAVLLFGVGSGPVRGFAVTLSLGILTSMFSAIMVTRLLVVVWVRRTRPKTLAL